MDKRIERAYDILKKRFHEKILLDDLAGHVKLSPFHLQRLFKTEMGLSPAECLIKIRLERSAHLLKAGVYKSISEVGMRCGFSSGATFTRSFSKKFGMSPSAFVADKNLNMKVVFVTSAKKNPDIEIVYVPDTYVLYKQTALKNTSLMAEFESVEDFCKLNKIPFEKRYIGIGTNITFHYPDAELNYNAGVVVPKQYANAFPERVYFIPKGKYSTFNTNDSVRNVQSLMMWHKISWMDVKGYVYRDLFLFEEFIPSNKNTDYPNLARRIFVPIKKK
jgi:AraC-like DNA-binding protein/predicted transcriptional regulator YdeE